MERHPPHTPESARIIQISVNLSQWLAEHNPRGFTFQELPDDPKEREAALFFRMRHKLAFSHFELALDHHTAIVHLCLSHLRSSAFPLARSLFDATWKGAWVAFAAPDDLLKRYTEGNFDPHPKTCIPLIESKLDTKGRPMAPFLSRVFKDTYRFLSDYSHAGLLPVTRWMGEDEISANYSDEEMEELLALSDRLAACCGIFLAEVCNTGRENVRQMLFNVLGLQAVPPEQRV